LLAVKNRKGKAAMIVCLLPQEQFLSYLAVVTITGDRAALDLCLALWLLAMRALKRAKPAPTWDLSLYGRIRRTGIHVLQWDSNSRRKDQ
jgi:hypothetical protein